ncbi:hypothetical protein QG37_00654 [Candidozyma auris]|uniref:Uncharacterized protein n=1 Tax=Candidozyma auris TaxID=498019 RepID=A0A0L0P824_CANAR|nr:hypothetical protein QG37_00654 [[Candida] auris]
MESDLMTAMVKKKVVYLKCSSEAKAAGEALLTRNSW